MAEGGNRSHTTPSNHRQRDPICDKTPTKNSDKGFRGEAAPGGTLITPNTAPRKQDTGHSGDECLEQLAGHVLVMVLVLTIPGCLCWLLLTLREENARYKGDKCVWRAFLGRVFRVHTVSFCCSNRVASFVTSRHELSSCITRLYFFFPRHTEVMTALLSWRGKRSVGHVSC